MEDPWSTRISECEVGAFAAVHSHYDDAFGLAIIKVKTEEEEKRK